MSAFTFAIRGPCI
jgi:DNA-binding Lrp family transcriptional regulator